MKKYILYHFFFFLLSGALLAQSPVPLLFKSLAPPITSLYYLEDIGLMGVANHQEIQLWDVKSRAYYGVITVVPPEFSFCHITHVEYLKDFNKIAVVLENQTTDPLTGKAGFADIFYLYDAVTLLPDPTVLLDGGGMVRLLKYKYSNKTILPVLNDEKAIYRYHYNNATDQLFTINREGDVNIYNHAKWKKKIMTGIRESRILFPAKNANSFFVTDKYKGILAEINVETGGRLQTIPLQFIPNNTVSYNYYGGAELVSVTEMPSEKTICILDSVNRMRILDTETDQLFSYKLDYFYGRTLIALTPNWTDSSIYVIAEEQEKPHTRMSFYTNLKTGITNNFTGGTSPFISAASATGMNTKFRMVVSGLDEIEVDLSSLTEKNISQFTTASNETIILAAGWEQGYLQWITDSNGGHELRVFRKDSASSPLLYSQKISFHKDELLAGIFPSKKWYLTVRSLQKNGEKNELTIYDSAGKKLHSVITAIPVQTLQSSFSRQQYLFSPDGKYMLIREIIKQAKPFDSCRLRVLWTGDFSTVTDIRYTEVTDFNSYNHKTAVFAEMVNGFYYIASTTNLTGVITNSLVHYSLTGKTATKKYETRLCLDNQCQLASSVRNINMSRDGKTMLWFGFVPADFVNRREAYQYCIFTNAETGRHYSGMNILPLPELMGVLPFPNYIGLQFRERIDFLQLAPNVPGPFLSVNPYVNENTLDLSLVYSTYDYKNQRPWYYEKTNNDDCISFRLDKNSFRRRQFDVTYNRPDMVLENVPGYDTLFKQLYFKAVSKRAERVPNMLQNFKPAEMPLLSFAGTKYLANGIFSIQLKIKSILAVNKCYVTINGNRVEYKVDIKARAGMDGNEPDLNFLERLTNGENSIEIIAITESGIESLPLRISQNHMKDTEKPNLYVLTVSVGKYQDGFNELPFAVKDGRDIARLMNGLEKDTLIKKIFIDSIFEEAVSELAVLNWIRAKKDLSPSDYVIVFFSGHGFLDTSLNLRLATSFTDIREPAKNSIAYELVLQEMDRLPARQKLLLIDACHSGDLDKNTVEKKTGEQNKDTVNLAKGLVGQGVSSKDNSFEIMQNLFSFSEPGKGTVVISASGGTQSAFEAARYQNGFFTYALKEAINDGKASNDPYKRLWLNQLVKYLKQRVTAMSGGKQSPNLRISNPDLNWRIK